MPSRLRAGGNPKTAWQRPSQVAVFSPPRPSDGNLGARAIAPAVGIPSAAWLERVLADERQFLAQILARRHEHLLLDLQAGVVVDLVEPFARVEANGAPGECCADVAEGLDDALVVESSKRPEQHRIASPPLAGHGQEPTCEPPHATRLFVAASTPSSKRSWTDEEEMPIPGEVPERELPVVTHVSTDDTLSPRKRESLMQMKQGMLITETLVDEEKSFFKRVVQDSRFELVMTAIVMCNAIVTAFQIQYDGMDVGYHLGFRWYDEPAKDIWTNGKLGIEVMDYIFGLCYVIELMVKVLAMKSSWLRDPWNYLDALIVGLWLIEKPFSQTVQLPADASILKTARLVRVLRLMKVLRTLQGLDSLYLLLTTLRGSFWILGWSGVLLVVTQMLLAMVFWFTLNEAYFWNEHYDLQERKELFEYFGTWTRAMLTMFEMTLANWPPVCRLLVRNFSEWFSLFCILHKLTMGFAVIGVINGVFMQETFKVASTDDKIMVRQREREVKVHTAKMSRLFQAADESGDGFIDMEEFVKIMKDKEILLWLSSMDITVRDPDVLFPLLDGNSDGVLCCEEFVRGALALRGVAKAADMLELRAQVGVIKNQLKSHGATSSHPR